MTSQIRSLAINVSGMLRKGQFVAGTLYAAARETKRDTLLRRSALSG